MKVVACNTMRFVAGKADCVVTNGYAFGIAINLFINDTLRVNVTWFTDQREADTYDDAASAQLTNAVNAIIWPWLQFYFLLQQ